MAYRKKDKGSAPNPAPQVSPDPTEEERVKVELPAEMKSPADESAVAVEEAPPAEEVAVEAAPEVVEEKRPLVDKGALDAEREKRKATQRELDDYKRIEGARGRYDEERRRLTEEATRKTVTPVDYNELPDMNAVAEKLREQMETHMGNRIGVMESDFLRAKTVMSEEFMRSRHDDYDQVLQDSGVQAAIGLDAQGRPVDPFLWNLIFRSDNPGLTAYTYAKGKLHEGTEVQAETRGEERGRKEVVEKIHGNAGKPRGIHSLPASSAGETGLTRRDIDNMSEDQKRWLKANRKDVWRFYLEG